MTIEVNEWLKTVIDWKNAKQICGTKDGKRSLEKADRVVLSGDLVIENLNNLENLNLRDVRELNKIVIKNCPKLKNINLLDSGIKQLEVGPGLDQLEELSIGFEIDSTDRPTPRKLDKVDLSNITNLKSFKCVGVQETELIGFEKLTQLESFLGAKGVKIPTNKFNSGIPITKDQWDKDYSQRPTKKEFERIQKLHKLIEDAAIKHWSKDQWKNRLLELNETYYNQVEQGKF